MSEPANRPGRGGNTRFKPGQSGNPTGRKAVPPDVRELFREALVPAVKRLIELAHDKRSPTVALRATEILIERVLGKPVIPLVNFGGNDKEERAELRELLKLLGIEVDETK